jgi:hypothetical protein
MIEYFNDISSTEINERNRNAIVATRIETFVAE